MLCVPNCFGWLRCILRRFSWLQGQLSEVMERITRMQQKKKRRRDVPRRAVKEEYAASGSSSRLGMASRDVIDLTLSD